MTELDPAGTSGPSASWDNLRRRAELLASLRRFFVEHGFLEVETPLLSAEVVTDRHLEPLRTTLPADVRQPERGRLLWLQTSPEAAMKRLVAAGGEAIFQVTRSFRGGEQGRLHNPEFTIVEWYRRGDRMADGMQLLSALCQELLGTTPAVWISYRDAFRRYARIDPLLADAATLAARAAAHGIDTGGDQPEDRDAWLDLLLVELVQPHLGRDRPTILYDYPASQAALAAVPPGEPPVAKRFELFVRGIELANGYEELTDPAELRRRAALANDQRAADGRQTLPEARRLLAAMQAGLPACSGVALGFDRLVMLAVNAASIQDVMAFPIDRA